MNNIIHFDTIGLLLVTWVVLVLIRINVRQLTRPYGYRCGDRVSIKKTHRLLSPNDNIVFACGGMCVRNLKKAGFEEAD